eukprot:767892-Hanusia_phi.AAC.1
MAGRGRPPGSDRAAGRRGPGRAESDRIPECFARPLRLKKQLRTQDRLDSADNFFGRVNVSRGA